MAAARHVRIALFFHPKLNTTASSPSPGTRSLERCALSQETELPGTHPIPTIGLLPIFPPAPTPTPPLHATQHFVQEALFIGFAMNKALSIGQQGGGFAGIACAGRRLKKGQAPRRSTYSSRFSSSRSEPVPIVNRRLDWGDVFIRLAPVIVIIVALLRRKERVLLA